MDARDRLRRYIEQRRELGESEFVLDALPVDDVLRMLGAPANRPSSGAHGGATKRPDPTARRDGSAASRDVTADPAEVSRGDRPVDRTDDDTSPMSEIAPVAPDTSAKHVREPDTESVSGADKPPAPDARFDVRASTDWRTTLSTVPPRPAPAEQQQIGGSRGGSDADGSLSSLPPWLVALGLPTGLTARALRKEAGQESSWELATLSAVADAIATCRACSLHASALNPVPGEGNPDADFVCVGEAPGASEDESGRPFVGAAGQLLTKILGAIHLAREDVFICNVLKHRPPGNRNPLPDEVQACTPYLSRQLELLRPRVILALGTFAAQTLLDSKLSIGKLRGQLHRYHGIPLVVTYHPAALLRNEAWKRPTWEDVKLARRILDASIAAHPSA